MAQIGIGFYLAIGVLLWACWVTVQRYEPGWLLLSVYGVYWLVMAAFQVRFAAQLTIILSILGGLGLVYLLSWVELARAPQPFRDRKPDEDATGGPAKPLPTVASASRVFGFQPTAKNSSRWSGSSC